MAKANVATAKANAATDAQTSVGVNGNDWLEEKVPIRLFWDSSRYKDDVYLRIGNESCLIKRGETVYVKRKFKLLWDQTERQRLAAAATQERASQNGNWS